MLCIQEENNDRCGATARRLRPATLSEPSGNEKTGSKALTTPTTTDHKQLGIMYIIMSFGFFFLGCLMALLIALSFSPRVSSPFLMSSSTSCSPCTAP